MKMVSLCLAFTSLLLLSGCGKHKQTDAVSHAPVTHKASPYKAQDKSLVQTSAAIPVYSDPASARRVLKREPDEVVNEPNGSVTHYYSGDGSANSERLRLRYSDGHLIGKEVVPPDVNASPAPVARTQLAEKDYGGDAGLPAARVDPNAAFNANFNQQLNLPARRN